MSPWLLENLNRIAIGLFGTGLLGVIGLFIRLSVKQSVRLYKSDLVECQQEVEALNKRSDFRETVAEDLIAEVTRLREERTRLESLLKESTTRAPTM